MDLSNDEREALIEFIVSAEMPDASLSETPVHRMRIEAEGSAFRLLDTEDLTSEIDAVWEKARDSMVSGWQWLHMVTYCHSSNYARATDLARDLARVVSEKYENCEVVERVDSFLARWRGRLSVELSEVLDNLIEPGDPFVLLIPGLGDYRKDAFVWEEIRGLLVESRRRGGIVIASSPTYRLRNMDEVFTTTSIYQIDAGAEHMTNERSLEYMNALTSGVGIEELSDREISAALGLPSASVEDDDIEGWLSLDGSEPDSDYKWLVAENIDALTAVRVSHCDVDRLHEYCTRHIDARPEDALALLCGLINIGRIGFARELISGDEGELIIDEARVAYEGSRPAWIKALVAADYKDITDYVEESIALFPGATFIKQAAVRYLAQSSKVEAGQIDLMLDSLEYDVDPFTLCLTLAEVGDTFARRNVEDAIDFGERALGIARGLIAGDYLGEDDDSSALIELVDRVNISYASTLRLLGYAPRAWDILEGVLSPNASDPQARALAAQVALDRSHIKYAERLLSGIPTESPFRPLVEAKFHAKRYELFGRSQDFKRALAFLSMRAFEQPDNVDRLTDLSAVYRWRWIYSKGKAAEYALACATDLMEYAGFLDATNEHVAIERFWVSIAQQNLLAAKDCLAGMPEARGTAQAKGSLMEAYLDFLEKPEDSHLIDEILQSTHNIESVEIQNLRAGLYDLLGDEQGTAQALQMAKSLDDEDALTTIRIVELIGIDRCDTDTIADLLWYWDEQPISASSYALMCNKQPIVSIGGKSISAYFKEISNSVRLPLQRLFETVNKSYSSISAGLQSPQPLLRGATGAMLGDSSFVIRDDNLTNIGFKNEFTLSIRRKEEVSIVDIEGLTLLEGSEPKALLVELHSSKGVISSGRIAPPDYSLISLEVNTQYLDEEEINRILISITAL